MNSAQRLWALWFATPKNMWAPSRRFLQWWRAHNKKARTEKWEHCGKRQQARYARQVRDSRLKIENGLVP